MIVLKFMLWAYKETTQLSSPKCLKLSTIGMYIPEDKG